MSPTRKTTRGVTAGGRKSARKSGSRARGRRADAATAGAGGAGQPASAGAPGQAQASGAPRSIPAESPDARAQAERDEKGITRPGYVRRDLAVSGDFQGVTYQAGEKREIPKAYADHLDLINVAPDASTEANRSTKFGGGKENDQAAQGKSIKTARDGALAAQRKHQQSDAFQAIAGQKSGSKK